jgi:hypothetical protein
MPQRRSLLRELVADLGRQCVDAKCAVHEHPDGVDPRRDLPALVHKMLAVAGGRPWALLMEDDVALAPQFGDLVPEALEDAAPFDAVTFFSRSTKDMRALERGERWRRFGPASFCMMQAVAVRRDLLVGFYEWAPSWYAAHPEHTHAADLLLGAWLSSKRARMAAHVPSLVQHRPVPSTLPGHRGVRQSATYTAVFGEVLR